MRDGLAELLQSLVEKAGGETSQRPVTTLARLNEGEEGGTT